MNKSNLSNVSSFKRVLFAGSLTLATLSAGCDQDGGAISNDPQEAELPQEVQENPAPQVLAQDREFGQSSGVPAIDTECFNQVPLKDPKNSAGVEYNADCSTAFVLPPIVGATKVGTFAPSLNMGFCKASEKASKVAETTMDSAEKMAERLARAGEKLEALREKIDAKEADLDRVTAAFDAGTAEAKVAEAKVKSLRDDYKAAKRVYSDCEMDAVEPKTECRDELLEAKRIKRAFQDQRDVLDDLELAVSKAEAQKEKLGREIERLEGKLVKDQKTHGEVQDLLLSLNERVMNLYREYAVLEGAMGNLNYVLEWDKMVEAYRNANPEFKGRIAPMPLDDMRFHVASYVGETTTLPALLAVSVPGIPDLPSHTTELEISDAPVPADPAKSGMETGRVRVAVQGGASNGAHVTLSLVGACPSYDDASKKIVPELLNGLMKTNVSYSYQVQAQRQYVAKYNMRNWLDSMEKIKQKTRPFSSKNLKEVATNAESSDWFKIDFSGNHADFEYTAEEQKEIKKEVADSLQANALRQLAHQTGVALPPVPRAEISETGLQQWSKRQKTLCGAFTWCIYADYAGKLLSDVWNNKTGIAKFKRANSVWQTQTVRGTKMIRRHGASSFMPIQGSFDPSDDAPVYEQKNETLAANNQGSDKDSI